MYQENTPEPSHNAPYIATINVTNSTSDHYMHVHDTIIQYIATINVTNSTSDHYMHVHDTIIQYIATINVTNSTSDHYMHTYDTIIQYSYIATLFPSPLQESTVCGLVNMKSFTNIPANYFLLSQL